MLPVRIQWPSTVEFGAGRIRELKGHLGGCGQVFLVCDPHVLATTKIVARELEALGASTQISTEIEPEPSFDALHNLLGAVRSFGPDTVVGIGGGSTLDLAKLVSVLFSGEQKVEDIIGIDRVAARKTRLVTIPTTSGTGSEVTPIAILSDVEHKLKKGIVSRSLIPDVAIVDPELTLSVPPAVTASTGMDAMTHCIEAFTNRHAHPIIDNIAIEGIRLIGSALQKAVQSGSDLEARTHMALGSLYGGLCLGPVNTAAVHAMAYPLGGEFKIAHGVANSVLLPFVMFFNLPTCTEKYARIALSLGVPPGKDPEAVARRGILRIRELSENCGIPSGLKALGIPESAIPRMAEGALQVKRLMDNNPRSITLDDAVKIYRNALAETIPAIRFKPKA